MTETALGVTLMIVVIICGNEIAQLVNPIAALLVMAGACASGVISYERAS